MPDQISNHLSVLGRRDFFKLTVGVVIITADVVTAGRIIGAPISMSTAGYGSGRYGAGKYGTTTNQYSVFLPVIGK